jgi:hypothetical protein
MRRLAGGRIAWLRALAAMVVLVAAAFVAIAPTPAYADSNRIEIVNQYGQLRADVMWASQDAFQGVFLWPNNTSGPGSTRTARRSSSTRTAPRATHRPSGPPGGSSIRPAPAPASRRGWH